MQSVDFTEVFSDSFETFKVFDALSIEQASSVAENTPKSIWQILNHLILFQDQQLKQLHGGSDVGFDEIESWMEESDIRDQALLEERIKKFNVQISMLKTEIGRFSISTPFLAEKLKLVQDISLHLSFHLGEIVLIRRQCGNYPWPGEMKVFLA